MPISYEVDSELDVIFEQWSGVVDAAVLGDHWKSYLADPAVMACRRTLVDIRDAQIEFTGREMNELVERIVLPSLAGRTWRTAVIVCAPLQRGVVRQYQVFAESYSRDALFEDSQAALAWLLEQPAHADS